jgi:hypothetical protein
MRLIARGVVIAPLMLAFATAANAATHRHRLPAKCSPGSSPLRSALQPYRQTIAVDRYAQVYSLGGGPPVKAPPPGFPRTEEWTRVIYGCVYGHRGAYALGVVPRTETTKYMEETHYGDIGQVLAGPIVAFESFVLPSFGRPEWKVVVRDLRTGRTLRDEPTGTSARSGPDPEQTAGIGHTTTIVVKDNGSVAWVVSTGQENGGYQVHAVDTTGSRLLASGLDINPSSLALAGSTLYWAQGGRAFSTTLN